MSVPTARDRGEGSPDRAEGIGVRIVRLREYHRWTQEEVGVRLGQVLGRDPFVPSTIARYESGLRPVTSRLILNGLAEVFGVSPQELTGQPFTLAATADLPGYQLVPPVRAALDEPDDPPAPRSLHDLGVLAARAMRARMACDLAALTGLLPPLLAEARHLWVTSGDPTAGDLYVRGLVTATLALKPTGHLDLAIRTAERAEQVATAHGDPVLSAVARFAVAQCALATGNRRRSLALTTAVVNTLDPAAGNDAAAWIGLNHLHAALSAATLGDPDTAGNHLDAAAELAAAVVGDPWWMEFTPANVATWRVGAALEDEPGRAPELAALVDPTGLRTSERRARLHLDAGRGHAAAGNIDAAIAELLAADSAAGDTVGYLRNRATAVELVGGWLRGGGHGGPALVELARRTGVSLIAA